MQVRATTMLRLAYVYPTLDVDFSPDQRWTFDKAQTGATGIKLTLG